MSLSPIIGITTCNPHYETLAIEAARRFRHFTGCDCIIITANAGSYNLMLEAVRVAHGRVFCLFDADYWFIRHTSLDRFIGLDGLAGVADPAALHDTFCQHDALTLGFPPSHYINTGFIVANSSDSRVILAFDRAGVLLAHKQAGMYADVEDKTEQSLLNKALNENQLPTCFLSQEWNTYLHSAQHGHVDTIPARPYAVHAAGIALHDKFRVLQQQSAVFSFA